MLTRRNTLLRLATPVLGSLCASHTAIAAQPPQSQAGEPRDTPSPSPAPAATAPPSRARPQTPTRLVLLTTEYAPYMSGNSADGGVALALGRAALERAGIAAEILFRPWARVLAEAERGGADGVLGIWHEASRERYLAYSQGLGISNRIGFIARVGSMIAVDDLPRLRQVPGLRIGTVRGYANPPRFEEMGFQTDLAVDDASNLRKLLAGRIDLVLIDKGVAFHLLQTQLQNVAAQFQWLEPAVADMPLHMALTRRRANHPAMLRDINRGLAELRESGEMARILKRSADWF